MRKAKLVCIAVICAVLFAPLFAYAGGPGPVKISTMSRVESHTKVADVNGNYGGETYIYNMISATRVLKSNVLGNIFYLNQYSTDNKKIIAHIGGATVIKVFSPKLIGTLGYIFSSNPKLGSPDFLNTYLPLQNQDRFSGSILYNINPKSKGVKYTLISGYGLQYNLLPGLSGFNPAGRNKERTISERIGAAFPIFNKNWTGELGYTYTYDLDKDINNVRLGQLTNQYAANLTYKLNKENRLEFGYLFINKLFGTDSSPVPNDSAFRVTLLHSFN